MLNSKYLWRATLVVAKHTGQQPLATRLAPAALLVKQPQNAMFSGSRGALNASQESFLSGTNSVYAEQMYEQWR
jgi:hypothetical protein